MRGSLISTQCIIWESHFAFSRVSLDSSLIIDTSFLTYWIRVLLITCEINYVLKNTKYVARTKWCLLPYKRSLWNVIKKIKNLNVPHVFQIDWWSRPIILFQRLFFRLSSPASPDGSVCRANVHMGTIFSPMASCNLAKSSNQYASSIELTPRLLNLREINAKNVVLEIQKNE